MYQSDIANAANVACNLSACVRDVLESSSFTISEDSITFHNGSDGLLVDAILELVADDNAKALATLKSTINRESRMLECFGAVIETVTQKNGKTRDKVTQKGHALSFKKTDFGMQWTVKAPKAATESEGDNILVETAKAISSGELSEEQLAKLAILLADAAATL
jgi:hypothetical protein